MRSPSLAQTALRVPRVLASDEWLVLVLLMSARQPHIRPAAVRDARALHALSSVDLDCPAWSEEWWHVQLRDPKEGRGFVVLERGSVVVGFVGYTHREPAYGLPRRHHITLLAVDRAYRRRGYGTLLMRAVLRELESQNALECTSLFVRPDNVAALPLYVLLGFSAHSLVPDYYGPGEVALLCVRREHAHEGTGGSEEQRSKVVRSKRLRAET